MAQISSKAGKTGDVAGYQATAKKVKDYAGSRWGRWADSN